LYIYHQTCSAKPQNSYHLNKLYACSLDNMRTVLLLLLLLLLLLNYNTLCFGLTINVLEQSRSCAFVFHLAKPKFLKYFCTPSISFLVYLLFFAFFLSGFTNHARSMPVTFTYHLQKEWVTKFKPFVNTTGVLTSRICPEGFI
jgi:hypothetical protein